MNSLASRRFTGSFMLFGAISGFLASFLLTIDKIKILKDAKFNPSCNINEVLNCKSVMISKQAEVFGFPNSLTGRRYVARICFDDPQSVLELNFYGND